MEKTADARGGRTRGEKGKSLPLFSVRAGGVDLTFLILVLLLLTVGLVMLFSASYAYALYNRGNSYVFISAQLVYAIAGVIVMILVSSINYQVLDKMAWPIMFVSLFLLIIVLFFPHDGARRWIDLGFTTFQPSEIAKFAVVILFAHLISIMYHQMNTFRHGILPFAVILAVIAGLMVAEPHLSGTILILSLGAVMLFVGGASLRWFIIGGSVMAAAGIAVLTTGIVGYAPDRITYWLDPFAAPRDQGFQTIQSLYAIGSGGLMGTGIGGSRQKYLYLPEPQNDFIFSIVCEELGFVGATIIVLLFALLVWRGFVIGMRCKDRFGSLVAVGLTAQVGLQTILNIMVVTNTIPNTGISLPFFSYGGTALIMLLAQMGIVLAISRQTTMEKQ